MSDPATFPRLANAGRPPDPPDMEMRLQALEANQAEFRSAVMRLEGAISAMGGKLDRFGDRLDRFGEKLDRMGLEVAELKGRVSQLPTTIMMISFTLAVLAGAGILKYYVR